MDPELTETYRELIDQYPPVVRDAIRKAMIKAHDVAKKAYKHAIRDEILEAVTEGLSTDGVPDEAAIALVLECHGEDNSGSSE